VTSDIYVILTELVALPLLAIAQELSGNAAGSPTDHQEELKAFLQKPAGEVARKYFEHPPYRLFAIRRLIELGDAVVTPALRRAFAEETEVTRRRFIAAALISLGDADPQYFDYVAQGARDAVDSQLPFPVLLSGSLTSTTSYRREFVQFVEEHGLELSVALQNSTFEVPAAVEALGEAADRRSFPILVHGLDSPNVMIVRAAAFGLARLHDNSGIQHIIAACTRLSLNERQMIAKALLYFDSPLAQRTARATIADTQLFERWQAQVKRTGWKGAMRDNGHSLRPAVKSR
jgi:HEAT repeat protein